MKQFPSIKKLQVFCDFQNGPPIKVGNLVENNGRIFFAFESDFIERGLEISPFKLPLRNGVFENRQHFFENLFGVFYDSLPDGWGKLLMDRFIETQGYANGKPSVLHKLAIVGENGRGALTYLPEINIIEEHNFEIDLDDLANKSSQFEAFENAELLPDLIKFNGSSGGARPKYFIAYNPHNGMITKDALKLPPGYESWLVKFASRQDRIDLANIEYAYYLMASAAGIEMSESKLLKGQSGKYYFATKRFDRIENRRIHMHSAAGMLHDNFRYSNLDYGHLMDAAFTLEKSDQALRKILQLMCFNILTCNEDDHSNNFSFLMDQKGQWEFAPAYDLVFSPSISGYRSTSVAGLRRDVKKNQIYELASTFLMQDAHFILQEVMEAVKDWNKFADQAMVTSASKKLIAGAIKEKIKSLV